MFGTAENVGAFGHEVNAAEDDVSARSSSGFLAKLVRVAAKIGEANDFIALIVVTENDALRALCFLGRKDALVHGAVGKDKIVFQTTNFSCSTQCLTRLQFQIRVGTLYAHSAQTGTGMLKASQQLQPTRCVFKRPADGVVEAALVALSKLDAHDQPEDTMFSQLPKPVLQGSNVYILRFRGGKKQGEAKHC